MKADQWHFPRKALAQQILEMFHSGLSSALTFFAPRRMGKTEFLLKDIKPLAESADWHVFYFSFLDSEQDAKENFLVAITNFLLKQPKLMKKTKDLLSRISKLGGSLGGVGASIEFTKSDNLRTELKDIFSELAKHGNILLLLDEIQALAFDVKNASFLAALRTALDINKDHIKVIFTGSSREGLRRMFSDAKAPFFHFGQNLNFPEFDIKFIGHLSQLFEAITHRKLDTDKLWSAFVEMGKVPQLIRSLVERLVLHPALTIKQAKTQLLEEIYDDRAFIKTWDACSPLERCVLIEIAQGREGLFSIEMKQSFAAKLGLKEVSVSSIQSALRSLLRKQILGRLPDRGSYFVDDPNFRNCVAQQIRVSH